jgi:uncharacterized protein with GYD domain
MPLYMHQWSYKDEHVKGMLIEKKERSEVLRLALDAFGGTLKDFYYCFGEYDALAITEFPDNKTALACIMSVYAQGRIDRVHTTALFSAEEGLSAILHAESMVKRQSPAG